MVATASSQAARKASLLLDRTCGAAALLCPLFLLHGRGVAEALIDVIALGFLLRSSIAGDWRWLRTPWIPVALLWWAWLTLCSVPAGPFGTGGWPSFLQALATSRFLLFTAALQHVLVDARIRRLMRWLLVFACLYIAAQMLLQDMLGRNLFGDPRFHDGTLTGPYDKPRAAAPLSRLLLPAMLVCSAWIMQRGTRRWVARALSLLPLLAGLAIMVLAGQRMPLLLTALGILVAAMLLRRLRLPLLAALAAAPLLILASALISPSSFAHLVLLFSHQMQHFDRSPYGRIYLRALSIAAANPLTGLGFDGFRHGCANPVYFSDWPKLGSPGGIEGGAAICVQHAHNHYLQALTDAGMPGLGLFCAMVVVWLKALARGLFHPATSIRVQRGEWPQHAWRVGLFAAAVMQEWPIASSSAFTNMPLGGWFFLLLGIGLAEADAWATTVPATDRRSREPPRAAAPEVPGTPA